MRSCPQGERHIDGIAELLGGGQLLVEARCNGGSAGAELLAVQGRVVSVAANHDLPVMPPAEVD